MARIKMPAARSTAKEITFEEAFHIFLTDSAARGLAEKTLKTYRTHLRDISHYFDISTPLHADAPSCFLTQSNTRG